MHRSHEPNADGTRCAACGIASSWPLAAQPCPTRHDVKCHGRKRANRYDPDLTGARRKNSSPRTWKEGRARRPAVPRGA